MGGNKFTKAQLIKKLIELGVNDIHLTYHKSEGWWLSCDKYDDWLSMDSSGAMKKIKELFEQQKQ